MSSDPCTRAALQFQKGDQQGALSSIQRCQKSLLKLLRKKPEAEVVSQIKSQLGRAYQFEGQILFSSKKIGSARKAFENAAQHFRGTQLDTDMEASLAQVTYSLGLIDLVNNNVDNAVKQLQEAKTLYLSSNKIGEAVEVLFRLATINRELGRMDISVELLNEIISVRRKIPRKAQASLVARAELEKGRIFRLTGFEKAEKQLTTAKKAFQKAKNNDGIAESLIELATLAEESDLVTAQEYLQEAMDISMISGNIFLQGTVLTRMGIIQLRSGQFEQGRETLLRGLKHRTDAGDKNGTAQTLVELSRIGIITSRNDEDLEKARNFAEQALDLYSQTNHRYGQATTLELLGSINTKLKSLDKARDQVQTGKKIFEEYNDTDGEARMLVQLGLILDQQNRNQDAIPVLEKALKLLEKTRNRQGKAEALHVLAMQYLDQREKSLELLRQSRTIYEEIIGSNKHLQIILNSLDATIEKLEQN